MAIFQTRHYKLLAAFLAKLEIRNPHLKGEAGMDAVEEMLIAVFKHDRPDFNEDKYLAEIRFAKLDYQL